jgi:site-specific DNA-methyltransferase (adenine-specific)
VTTPVIIGDTTLYCGRMEDILPSLRADACVTDPPYGIKDAAIQGQGRTGKRVGKVNTWHDESWWDEEIDPEWPRLVSAIAPVVAWFGHWRKREEVAAAMQMPLRAEIIWAKDCHVGPPCPVAMRDERIWIFGKDGIKGRTFETSVWDVPIIPTWAHKHHKNEKPVALMRRLVDWIDSETICDPFMGSGTTGVACVKAGRRFIGVEQDPQHFETACRRIEQAYAQPDMFVAPPVKPVQEQMI